MRWGDPQHPEIQDRTGIGDVVIAFFKELEDNELLIGSER